MILTTHAIVGAALATFLPQEPWAPYAATALGFVSHFPIDAIPHWDYPIRSAAVKPNSGAPLRIDRALWRDAAVIGTDSVVGLILAVALFASWANAGVVIIAAVAAMMPDPLQFAQSRFPHEPLNMLQRFHRWIHTNQRLEGRVMLGVLSQLLFVVGVVAVTILVHRVVCA